MLAIVPSSHAYDNGDFQIWNTQGQEWEIGKGTTLTQEEEWKYGDVASELFSQHYEWGVIWGFDNRLDLGITYRQVYEKDGDDWLSENRPYATATLKHDLWKFKFVGRNRIEYRHFDYDREDFIRYRHRSMLKLPIDFKGIKITPHISNEIFIVSNGDGFSQDRAYIGLEFDPERHFNFDIYYMAQYLKRSEDKWSYVNVLGFKLRVSF
ncbi:MAG TPA: DUF2490 domain-containing protein [Candidatus Omnitrophota bacterium]|nr:DUF2490 domain-containing protein [Candidatus Omnitrophota bacterium]